ncbi:hypothetical protein ACLK19_04465 [Escherichia coli]
MESFDVPLKKTGAYQWIDIRFSYDMDGLLKLTCFWKTAALSPE